VAVAPEPPVPAVAPAPPQRLQFSGYLQVEAVTNQLSEDEVTTEGTSLNLDRVRVRRARLKVERSLRYAHFDIELDGNTMNGPAVALHHAEASAFLPPKDGEPSMLVGTAGLSDMPFGFELTQGSQNRLFMERTLMSRAFFTGETDIGLQGSGALGPLRYALGVVNGQPVNDNPNQSTAPIFKQKTFVGRVGAYNERENKFQIAGGVSLLDGKGLHVGTPATKDQLTWTDSNEDGVVTLDELQAIPAQAPTASELFDRWGLDADVRFSIHTRIGWTRVQLEGALATNLDRNYFVADPISAGYDVQESGWSASVTQDVKWAIVGVRQDSYNPASDLFEAQRGEFLPLDASVSTTSPLIGAQIPDVGKLLVQYDYIVDSLDRGLAGQPIDLPNDQWTIRVQGEL
jgi:hypothetical protein